MPLATIIASIRHVGTANTQSIAETPHGLSLVTNTGKRASGERIDAARARKLLRVWAKRPNTEWIIKDALAIARIEAQG